MSRLREHHSLVGEELAKLDQAGYFAKRSLMVRRRWPIAAPNQFRIVYAIASAVLAFLAITAAVRPTLITSIFG